MYSAERFVNIGQLCIETFSPRTMLVYVPSYAAQLIVVVVVEVVVLVVVVVVVLVVVLVVVVVVLVVVVPLLSVVLVLELSNYHVLFLIPVFYYLFDISL